MGKDIKYEDASMDVTLFVVKDLNKKFAKNKMIENLEVIESNFKKYSIIKLDEWNKDISDFIDWASMENDNDFTEAVKNISLNELLETLNNAIPYAEHQRGFFKYYNDCLMYLIGALNNQENEIVWGKETLDKDAVIIHRGGEIRSIITNDKLQPYQVPSVIIEEYRNELEENEKVLTK